MKYKTTAKEVRDGYSKIVSVGYCDMQNLLYYHAPIAYSKGAYGWNFDVYEVNSTAVATGYRGMPSKNSKSDYTLVREYETKAEGKSMEERETLLLEFIQKATS